MGPVNPLLDLLSTFKHLSTDQVSLVYKLADGDMAAAEGCLACGPTRSSLIALLRLPILRQATVKVYLDPDYVFCDLVAYYKREGTKSSAKPIQMVLRNQPAIDTGGVRRQVFTDVYGMFASNSPFQMFEGEPSSLRPLVSAENKQLMKVLGTMLAHSIVLDEIGFPYLSQLCYWLIAEGEESALNYVGLSDVAADARYVVDEVSYFYVYKLSVLPRSDAMFVLMVRIIKAKSMLLTQQ